MPKFGDYTELTSGNLADEDIIVLKEASSGQTKKALLSSLKTYTGSNPHIFVQSADPAGSAIDGDIWIQIP